MEESNKKYEEYLEKSQEIEKKREAILEERRNLEKEYGDVVVRYRAELEEKFKEEQTKLGLSFEGKYFRFTRKLEDNADVKMISYFKLDKYERFDGRRGEPFVRFLMFGAEVMTLMNKDGNVLQLNSRIVNTNDTERNRIIFVHINDEMNTTEEITKEEFINDIKALRDVYYGNILN